MFDINVSHPVIDLVFVLFVFVQWWVVVHYPDVVYL